MFPFFFPFFAFSHLFEINAADFDRLVIKGDGKLPLFVMFMNDHCPHCETAKLSFEDAYNELNDTVKFVTFNIDKNDENIEFAQEYEIFHVPQFVFFFRFNSIPYEERRTIKGFKIFVTACLEALLPSVNDSWIDTHEDRVILFSHRRIVPKELITVFGKYHRRNIDFAMTNNKTFASNFPGVTFSSWWFFRGKEKKMQYKGPIEADKIGKAIETFFEISPKGKKKPRKIEQTEL